MLLTPNEVDAMLRYPRGRSARLARRGLLPAITLPDDSVRFKRDAIERIVSGDGDAPNRLDTPPGGVGGSNLYS